MIDALPILRILEKAILSKGWLTVILQSGYKSNDLRTFSLYSLEETSEHKSVLRIHLIDLLSCFVL